MTLDEAIAYHEWAAENCVGETSEEHARLAAWLRELRGLRETTATTEVADTCEWCKDGKTFDRQTVMVTNHGWQRIRHCPNCGRRIKEETE
jgi:hypothetical protein